MPLLARSVLHNPRSSREKDPILVEGITRHALRKAVGSPAKPSAEDDAPRGSPQLWMPLGAVVYAWSDRRHTATDRAWWKKAGGRRAVVGIGAQQTCTCTQAVPEASAPCAGLPLQDAVFN